MRVRLREKPLKVVAEDMEETQPQNAYIKNLVSKWTKIQTAIIFLNIFHSK